MAAPTIAASELSRLLGQWATGDGTLARDLSGSLVELIRAGLIPPGAGLPAQRTLAEALTVSRGTVTAAYEALTAEGYLATDRGSGSRVRSAHHWLHRELSGRFFSFTDTPTGVIDLSTGALPASPVTYDVLARPITDRMGSYLLTDGYFPAGLPALRQAIADRFTADGTPTSADQILVTSGAQEATWLAITGLAGPGDLVLTEEPTYRGALEALRGAGARVEGMPMVDGGLDPDRVRRAATHGPELLYCQTSIHNPTGGTMTSAARRGLAEVINDVGLMTIEDACSSDLTLAGRSAAPTLARLVDPELLVTIGSASKLFWGGIRIGWIRASADRIHGLVELRKPVDLATSVVDQVLAVDLIARTEVARTQRRALLTEALAGTTATLREMVPDWTWEPIAGGSGLWVDIGGDAVALVERAKRAGIKLVAGPGFSTYGGYRDHLRLPVWHEREVLRAALGSLT
ncbi:PLP-dependent aminotransferase family protein [Actinotalea sp. M2MS4P-6]|uniref:aminotransferase-like domain-containing protein n=1 Tax=Actinotalea sp. M2MS4P-6 TaxID=2983762 RepID=UPI0021E3D5FC|nr:PLP-dependent aminotransferase family protein [Actinotalea sp. M2MS4P-6]MCV2394476.1 PLP-dependent aminotransferase family protein [Actinotalea sp. M2MS4P-6]